MPATASRLDTLALTAWWTAAARARESARDDRLFDDRWAAILAGRAAVDAFDDASREQGPGTGDLQAVITRHFDDLLIEAAGVSAIDQVVLLASGLDTRAFRLDWPSGVRVFDVDQEHVAVYKRTRFSLMEVPAACDWRPIGADLRGGLVARLCDAGFDPARPSAWLLEACLHFFDPAAVYALLETITAAAAAGSRLGFDTVNADFLRSPATRVWHEQMAPGGAPWLFTCDRPDRLLAPLGWQVSVADAREAAARMGRAVVETAPTGPYTPRALLVSAVRAAPLTG